MRQPQHKYGSTCGVKPLKYDPFADVKRALHKNLMEKDERYRKASAQATERNARRREIGQPEIEEIEL